MTILYQRAWEKANFIKLTQIIAETYFVCSGTIPIFKSSFVYGHASDLQGQVALNFMQYFSLFLSVMFFSYDSGHIFTACKFHSHIANFLVMVYLFFVLF